MYLNKKQIYAVKVALDVMDIMLVYDETAEDVKSAKEVLEELKIKSEQKLKTV